MFYNVVRDNEQGGTRRGADGPERGGVQKVRLKAPAAGEGRPAGRDTDSPPATSPPSLGGGLHVVSASDGVGQLPRTAASPAALVDEEWWLLSAGASRSDEERAGCDSTPLLPTFSEAVGEGGGAQPARCERAQRAGRSCGSPVGAGWRPIKSGKNPWVEPVASTGGGESY